MKSFFHMLGRSWAGGKAGAWPSSRATRRSRAPSAEGPTSADLWNGPIPCTLLSYQMGRKYPRRGEGTAGAGSEAPLGVAQQPLDVAPVRPEHEDEEDGGE